MKEYHLPLPDSDPLHAFCSGQSSDLRYQEVAVRTEGGQKRGLKVIEMTQMQVRRNLSRTQRRRLKDRHGAMEGES